MEAKHPSNPSNTGDNTKKEKINTALVYTGLLHILPVIPTRKREKGFKRIIQVNWGKVEKIIIKAIETLNAFDLSIMLAVLSYIYENRDKLKEYELKPKDENDRENIEYFYVTEITPYSFIKNYCNLNPLSGSRIKKIVFESLNRLNDCYWQFYLIDGQIFKTRVLENFKQNADGKWILYFDKNRIDRMLDEDSRKNGLYLKVVLNFIRKCKTDIGKLLCYWLQGQKNNRFSEDLLMDVLHLEYERKRDARLKLREGFEDIKQSRYIESWKIEKRDKTNFFVFKKTPFKQIINCQLTS